MLMAGGTSTLTRQYGTPAGVVAVETDVIDADESFGGFVVGNVGRSEMRCVAPMPAASHVVIGVLLTGAASAAAVPLEPVLAVGATSAGPGDEPPPPQPTSTAAPTKTCRAARPRGDGGTNSST